MNLRLTYIVLLLFHTASVLGQVKEFSLVSRMDGVMLDYHDDSLNFWGFGFNTGPQSKITMPAPLIEVNEGDTVIVNLFNPAIEAHTVHLHGLDVDQANDGVPGTSFFVLQNDTGSYTFIADYAGNFLYHCHVTTVLHMQMGMFGPLIVRPLGGVNSVWTDGPSFDREYFWMAYDLDKSWHDDYQTIGSFVNYFPDHFMINDTGGDKAYADSSVRVDGVLGEKILLRIFNTDYGKQSYHFPTALGAVALTNDGRVLTLPDTLDTLQVYPGERYGVLLTPSTAIEDTVLVQYQSLYEEQLWGEGKIPISIGTGIEVLDQLRTVFSPLIFPNPSGGRITISVELKSPWRCTLYDGMGKSLKRFDLKENRTEVDLSQYGAGVYLLSFFQNGEWIYREIIIE